jgi:uncharacterized OsmC-like protein
MLGTFGGALEARQIPATGDRLVARVLGEIELEGKVLVIRRIHVKFELRADAAHHPTVERVHGFYADSCPVYRSIHASIAITSEVVLLPS